MRPPAWVQHGLPEKIRVSVHTDYTPPPLHHITLTLPFSTLSLSITSHFSSPITTHTHPSPSLHTSHPSLHPHYITLPLPITPPSTQGFKIQDTRDISPWDVIEGIKNFGPLNLSWFGAVRMERRVPKYEVQTKLIQCHAHKKNAVGHSFVQFADPAEVGEPLRLHWKCC